MYGAGGIGRYRQNRAGAMQHPASELPRIRLLRLSEKGYEQRSEREFGRAGRQKWVEKCRFGAL
jgi:hypothetical protein